MQYSVIMHEIFANFTGVTFNENFGCTLSRIYIYRQISCYKSKQVWILAPDIGQCPVKNRVMSGEVCFTTDTVIRLEIKNIYISYRRLKTQKHSVNIGLYRFGFFIHILTDNLLIQFFHIPTRTTCLSKKILYQYFVVVFCRAPAYVTT